jgi:tetratricopeptide (TPR) repeat protein
LITAWIERRLLGAEGADFTFGVTQRILLAGRVIAFYVGTLLWPIDLTFIYPRWQIAASDWTLYLYIVGVLATLAGAWLIRRRSRAPLAVALFFIGSLFPVLGFVNVYPFVFSFVADHFAYVPSLALIAAVAAGLTWSVTRVAPDAPWWVRQACAAALIGGLGILTWRQSHLYRDPHTLYEATLARNSACYLCLNNLGTIAFEAGRVDDARARFAAAVAIKPESAEAQSNLANILVITGSIPEGIEHYQQALKAAPNNVMTRTNLGIALVRLQRIAEARSQFEEALRIMPDYAPARQNLSVIQALPGARE